VIGVVAPRVRALFGGNIIPLTIPPPLTRNVPRCCKSVRFSSPAISLLHIVLSRKQVFLLDIKTFIGKSSSVHDSRCSVHVPLKLNFLHIAKSDLA